MAKRKRILISSINLLPNIKDIHLFEETYDKSIVDLREQYAIIVLLLFYLYGAIYDLVINDSYWDKYKIVISKNKLSRKSLEVIQNIQDESYNCSNLCQVNDELETTTIFIPHESDSKRKCGSHS